MPVQDSFRTVAVCHFRRFMTEYGEYLFFERIQIYLESLISNIHIQIMSIPRQIFEYTNILQKTIFERIQIRIYSISQFSNICIQISNILRQIFEFLNIFEYSLYTDWLYASLWIDLTRNASYQRGPRSWVCARLTLRSGPYRQ